MGHVAEKCVFGLKVRGSLADAHNAGFVRLLWELLHVLE